MKKLLRGWRVLIMVLGVSAPLALASADIFLLKTYDGTQSVVGWVMSEKLDGVRGVWDGEKLISRGGKILPAPDWFIKDFPAFALDGELWSKRGDFENIVSIVRSGDAERWRQLRYYVFEVPHQNAGLRARLSVVQEYLNANPSEWIEVIEQTEIKEQAQLQKFLRVVSEGGGEGVVVRDPNTPYQTGRLNSALKVKNYQDAECIVRGILSGKGKYKNQMGALHCEMADAKLIKIGSGFSDAERANPPPLGARVTFKYYGLTNKGNPRFPVYLRRRD